MAEEDIAGKIYMGQKTVFADIVNGVLFNHRHIIEAERLRDTDPTTPEIYERDGDKAADERFQDILREAELDGTLFALFGIENQTYVDETMPFRVLEYIVRQYRKQLRLYNETEKRKYEEAETSGQTYVKQEFILKPVTVIVIYWSPYRWTGPRTLAEMMKKYLSEELVPYVHDFQMILLEPRSCGQDWLEGFETDFGNVLGIVKNSGSKRKLMEFAESRELKFSREGADFVNFLTGADIITVKEGEKNMREPCAAVKEIRAEGEDRILTLINCMLSDHCSLEDISRLKEDRDYLERMLLKYNVEEPE